MSIRSKSVKKNFTDSKDSSDRRLSRALTKKKLNAKSIEGLNAILDREEPLSKSEGDRVIKELIKTKVKLEEMREVVKHLEDQIDNLNKENTELASRKTAFVDQKDLEEFIVDWDSELLRESNLEKRTKCALEILTTELSYVNGIAMLVKNYLEPFRDYIKEEGIKLPHNVETTVFLNIEVIYYIGLKICDDLKQCMDQWKETGGEIGQIFVTWSPKLFGPYKGYIRDYTKGLALLNELKEESNWTKFISERDTVLNKGEGLLESSGTFRDLYVTPVQRIPRYLMLMSEINKNTPDDHSDKENITRAVSSLADLADKVNESMHESEKSQMFNELITRGKGFNNLIISPYPIDVYNRIWVEKLDILKITVVSDTDYKKNRKYKELQFFNDIIIGSELVTKDHHSEYYQPYTGIWISRDLSEWKGINVDDELPSEFNLYIRGPLHTWCVSFETASEVSECYSKLVTAMKLVDPSQNYLSKGERKTVFEYPYGTYSGSYENFGMKGNGTFRSADGTVFRGYWNHEIEAGFGTITENGETFESGWRINKDWIENAREDYMFWDHVMLTHKDWNILRSAGSERVILNKNDHIITQGIENDHLFWLSSGTVRIEKKSGDSTNILVKISTELTIFGDTAILPNVNQATASVVGDHDGVEVYSIALDFLIDLFKTNPGLATRFYRMMAIKLADRLKNQNSDQSKKSTPKIEGEPDLNTSDYSGNSFDIEEASFDSNSSIDVTGSIKKKKKIVVKENPYEIFDLSPTQVHIMTIECSFSSGIGAKKQGQFFLFQEYIGFVSNIFGLKSKELIDFSRVSDIVLKKNKLKIKVLKKKYIFSDLHEPQEVADLIFTLWEKSGTTGKTKSFKHSTPRDEVESVGFQLSEEEKDLLINGKEEQNFEEGEVIIHQGENHQSIYQIMEGSCKICIGDSKRSVARLKTGDIFGEITFLEKGEATASVVADKGGSRIAKIDGAYINALFVNNPHMAGHFYSYLAQILAERLNERENKKIKKSHSSKRRHKRTGHHKSTHE